MIAIIIDHLLYHAGGFKKFKYKELQLLNILCMWHVCSFGIISGLVGNKNHKYSSLLHLWIVVTFYSFLFYIHFYSITNLLSDNNLTTNIFPVISANYWYFTPYFGVYPFLPFINESMTKLSVIQLKKGIYFMIGIFTIWAYIYRDRFSQQNGHTPFSLLIFYIFGSYIGKNIFYKNNSLIKKIFICFLCFFLFIFISLICYNINNLNIKFKLKNVFRIEVNSFPMVFQTFCITIFISQIKFHTLISKIISFIGPLTFDVYLIHENPHVRANYIRNALNGAKNNLNLFHTIIFIIKKAIFIFFICIFIAYIRNIIFKIFKIKNICIKFDIMTNKIFNYLI